MKFGIGLAAVPRGLRVGRTVVAMLASSLKIHFSCVLPRSACAGRGRFHAIASGTTSPGA